MTFTLLPFFIQKQINRLTNNRFLKICFYIIYGTVGFYAFL
ncbi:hypothetical protein AsAng_0029130 [Aureispira anguillae]|uniref:Uncharacterized protein n=1 Tax=Aureispira anguillae TaxID=2864201 RepID=A0A915YFU2_9BACT|nr:hypothetical protein AsAng_0029130 [Aureispira anguillae]